MHPNVKRLLDLEFDEQRSEAWLKLRGNMLTASDCAASISANKYQTPDDLLRKSLDWANLFEAMRRPRGAPRWNQSRVKCLKRGTGKRYMSSV